MLFKRQRLPAKRGRAKNHCDQRSENDRTWSEPNHAEVGKRGGRIKQVGYSNCGSRLQ